MSCVIRAVCLGDDPEVLYCKQCVSLIVAKLCTVPGMLRLLAAETPKSLARPPSPVPARPGFGPGSPAREHLMDVSAAITDAVAEWSAVTGHVPARTIEGIADACARLAGHPYRHLAALGALEEAQALLRATYAARRALGFTTKRRTRCPECGTPGLVIDGDSASCDYCGTSSSTTSRSA